MKQFIKNIVAGQSVLSSRAAQMGKQAEVAVSQTILSLEQQIEDLKMKKENLNDFAPETTDSLRPSVSGKNGWNANEWVKKNLAIDNELYSLGIELDIAKNFKNQWFGEGSDEGADAEGTEIATVGA